MDGTEAGGLPGDALVRDVCARLCHDIGGPLGALDGALDLIGPGASPDLGAEAMEVAREALAASLGRLRLWRAMAGAGLGEAALGGVGEDGPMPGELAALLIGAWSSGRLRVDLSAMGIGRVPGRVAPVLLAAGVLAGEALPRGGTVRMAAGDGRWSVWPEGAGAAWTTGLAATLLGAETSEGAARGEGEGDVQTSYQRHGARAVVAPLLAMLARQAGLTLIFGEGRTPPALLLRS